MGQVFNLAMFTMDRTVTQSVYRLPARLLPFVLTRSLARPPRGWAPPTFHQPASCRGDTLQCEVIGRVSGTRSNVVAVVVVVFVSRSFVGRSVVFGDR